MDVLIEFNSIVIGIEVKLYSGLSSDDNVDNSSCNCDIDSNHPKFKCYPSKNIWSI
ncbi:MAG TPA: hypothetical protein GX527_01265 [Clostridiaceae bacterium]|nr:hypothetical protein [Clostridiaceae bacterium]